MKRSVISLAALSLLTGVAHADTPAIWSGLYLGANATYGSGDHQGTGIYSDPTITVEVFKPGERTVDLDGWMGGGQLGYNFQVGHMVFGVEGDADFGSIEGDGSFATADGYTWNIKTETDWLATLRGRVGFLVSPSLLLYGTGGVAWAGIDSNEEVICGPTQCLAGNNPTTVRASASETATGWVVGAGAEWALAKNWTLKAEWQHIKFSDLDTQFKGTAYPDNDPVPAIPGYANDSFPGDLTLDVVKLGVNYRF
jgi:outer membrane immunogenic protein